MTSAEEWANVVRGFDVLLGRSGAAAGPVVDPRRIAEAVSGHSILLGGPTEVFSQRAPAHLQASSHDAEDIVPIDVVFGRYDPERLCIEIFVNNIRRYASRWDCNERDLLTVVRVHEYAHAIVHTGVDLGNVEVRLAETGPGAETDWGAFRARRDEAFRKLDASSHELLAQAIAWAGLCREIFPGSAKLAEAFLLLEARQPEQYRLSPEIRLRAQSADWPLVLKAARGEIGPEPGGAFSLRDGLEALVASTGRPGRTIEPAPDHPLLPLVGQLQQQLAEVDLGSAPAEATDFLKILARREGYVELRLYKEAAHSRPHFHIEYKREFGASYALDNFERLAGFVPRKHEEAILPCAKANRDCLMQTWQCLNGGFRVVAESPS